jgi:hypothetical protein
MKTLQSNGQVLIKASQHFPGTGNHDPWHQHGNGFGVPFESTNSKGEWRWSFEWVLNDGNLYVYSGPIEMTATEWTDVYNQWHAVGATGDPTDSIGEKYNYVWRAKAMIKMTQAEFDAWASE